VNAEDNLGFPDIHLVTVKVWEKMNAKRFDKIMLKTKTGTPMTQPPPCNAGLALTPTKIKRLSGGRTEHDKCVWASENRRQTADAATQALFKVGPRPE